MTRLSVRLTRLDQSLDPGRDRFFSKATSQHGRTDQLTIETLAQWAGTSPDEVIAEAIRLRDLCVTARAWTPEAKLSVMAADSGMPIEALRQALADCTEMLERSAA